MPSLYWFPLKDNSNVSACLSSSILSWYSTLTTRHERFIDSKRNTASNQFKLSYKSSLEMWDEGVEWTLVRNKSIRHLWSKEVTDWECVERDKCLCRRMWWNVASVGEARCQEWRSCFWFKLRLEMAATIRTGLDLERLVFRGSSLICDAGPLTDLRSCAETVLICPRIRRIHRWPR